MMPSEAVLQWKALILPGWACSVLLEEGGKYVATVWSHSNEEYVAIGDDAEKALWAALEKAGARRPSN
jgi:hypothetical protein